VQSRRERRVAFAGLISGGPHGSVFYLANEEEDDKIAG